MLYMYIPIPDPPKLALTMEGIREKTCPCPLKPIILKTRKGKFYIKGRKYKRIVIPYGHNLM